MRRRILDLFKKVFSGRKNEVSSLAITETHNPYQQFQGERKAPPNRWLITHNQIQAKNANKLRKRRAKNKMARKSRQINYEKAS